MFNLSELIFKISAKIKCAEKRSGTKKLCPIAKNLIVYFRDEFFKKLLWQFHHKQEIYFGSVPETGVCSVKKNSLRASVHSAEAEVLAMYATLLAKSVRAQDMNISKSMIITTTSFCFVVIAAMKLMNVVRTTLMRTLKL